MANPIYSEFGFDVNWPVVEYYNGSCFLFYGHWNVMTDVYYAVNFTYQGVAIRRDQNLSAWDGGYVELHSILKFNSTHWIGYYCGNPQNGYWKIGAVFSLNLSGWSKYFGNPILKASDNEKTVADPCVLRLENGTYYMYYASYDYENKWQISKATSNDGLNFTKYSKDPILTKRFGTWYNEYVACTGVRQVNNTIQLLVIGKQHEIGKTQLGIFESDLNGNEFHEALTDPVNPCVPCVDGSWEDLCTNHADFETVEGITYIYYAGFNRLRWQLGRAIISKINAEA